LLSCHVELEGGVAHMVKIREKRVAEEAEQEV